MSLIYQDVFKICLLQADDKIRWKKYKIRLDDVTLVMGEKDSKISKSYSLASLSLVQYPKNNIIMMKYNPTGESFLARLDKKYNEWIGYFSTVISSTTDTSDAFKSLLSISKPRSSFTSLSLKSPRAIFFSTVFTPDGKKSSINKSTSLNEQPRNTPSHVKLFGGNLQDIYQSYGNKLPQFFEQFLINIEKNGLNISGIYRESGNNDMTKKLKDLIEKRQDFDLNEYHIHVQTSIVKLFLRELRRKIFPQNILSQFYGIKANSDRIECVINAISCLDSSCKSVLYRLVRHFTMINDHSANNLMDFYNISVVFGPTLIECDVLEMLKSVDLIKFILLNHDDIFKEQFYNYLEKPIEISELKFIDECRNSNQNDILSDARKSIISTPEIYISSTNKLIRTYTDDIKLTRVSDSTPHSVLQRLNKTSGDARNKKFFNIVAGPSNTFSIVPNR